MMPDFVKHSNGDIDFSKLFMGFAMALVISATVSFGYNINTKHKGVDMVNIIQLNQDDFKMKIVKDLGMVRLNETKKKIRMAVFECSSCGKHIEGRVYNVKRGNQVGCRACAVSKVKKTHGDSLTSLYAVWNSMKQRCDNPKSHAYNNYGGRGISVDSAFVKYEHFKKWALLNGYVYGLTIERENNNGNYTPLNCKWIPLIEQANNKRNTRYLTVDGERLTLTQASSKYGIARRTIEARLNNKWSDEASVKTSLQKNGALRKKDIVWMQRI